MQAEQKVKLNYMVGTMIEIPRGALTADEIAQSAEFFSFGTNDLTQTGLGMSRDDSGSFLPHYQELEIVKKNPFATIDATGVGQLVEIAVDQGARDASQPQARHLRRARRRPVVDPVLREGRARLRELLAVPRAGRPAGRSAGGARGQGRGLITIFKHENGSTRSSIGWTRPGSSRKRRVGLGRSRSSPTPEEAQILTDVFHFHELAVEDALSELHHPKVESYGNYLYLILHGIDFQASEHCFTTKDIDFFLGAQYLVTVHPGVSRSIGKVGVVLRPRLADPRRRPGHAALPHRRHDGRQLSP